MLNLFRRRQHGESLLQRQALPFVLAAVVLTRLPFLFTGYGSDPDAWLVAAAASSFYQSGIYQPSRLPGYPLHELVMAPAVGIGGAALSNTATLAAALCTITVWWIIVRRLAHHPFVLLSAFSFAPVFWQHSAVTLDYVWSLLCILLALHLAINKKVLLSGAMIGIAAGFRPPNSLIVLPIAAFLLALPVQKKTIAQFVGAALCVAAIAFLVLIVKYNGVAGWFESTQREMSDMVFSWTERLLAFGYRSVYFFGPLALLIALPACFRVRRTFSHALHLFDPIVISSLVAVATFLLLFLWLPMDRAYLLPILPFIMMLLDRLLSKRMLVVVALALTFHGLVNLDVVRRERAEKSFGFNVHFGMVVEEVRDRLQLLREREFFSTYPYPDRSIVMIGGGAAFWFENEHVRLVEMDEPFDGLRALQGVPLHRLTSQATNPTVLFLPHLFKDELERFQRQGYAVFCTVRAQPHIEKRVGYSMEGCGVTVLGVGLE